MDGVILGITRVSISSSAGRLGGLGRLGGIGDGRGVLARGSSQAKKVLHREQNCVPGGFCSPQASQVAVVIVVGPPLV